MATIGKKELIEQLAHEFGYTKTSATDLVNDFCKIVLKNLEDGNPVSIYGFGCFDIKLRKQRRCISPSGDDIIIPEHWIAKFYPGNSMKRAVKKWEDNDKRGL